MISWSAIRELVDSRIRSAVARVWTISTYKRVQSSGAGDQVYTADDSNTYSAQRIQHFGLRTMPPVGTTAVRLGSWEGAANAVIIAEDARKYGPSNLSEGDVCLYNNQSNVQVLLKASDGSVTISDKAGNAVTLDGTSTVQVNGNTYSMLKTETFLTALSAALSTIAPSNGGGPILTDGGTAITSLTTNIASGSYKSTKAKNG